MVVPESQYAKLFTFQIFRSLGIIFSRIRMLSAIDLDRQPAFEADEIDDKRSDIVLRAKFEAIDISQKDRKFNATSESISEPGGAVNRRYRAESLRNGRMEDEN
jgi:hypothetical protein